MTEREKNMVENFAELLKQALSDILESAEIEEITTPNTPLETWEKEYVVGEMTSFEKNCYSFVGSIVRYVVGHLCPVCDYEDLKPGEVESPESRGAHKKCHELKDAMSLLAGITDFLIMHRLDLFGRDNMGRIDLREDGVIIYKRSKPKMSAGVGVIKAGSADEIMQAFDQMFQPEEEKSDKPFSAPKDFEFPQA